MEQLAGVGGSTRTVYTWRVLRMGDVEIFLFFRLPAPSWNGRRSVGRKYVQGKLGLVVAGLEG